MATADEIAKFKVKIVTTNAAEEQRTLGQACLDMYHFDKAIDHFERGLSLFPGQLS